MAFEDNDTKISTQAMKNTANRNSFNLILRIILKKWWLFLIIGAVAGLGGIIYASMQKITYKSRLTFALDEGEGGGISGALSIAAQFGLSIGSGKDIFAGDNIIEIMKSRRMIEKTLLSVDTFQNKPYTFIEYYLTENKKPDSKPITIHFPAGQSRSSFTHEQDSLLYECYNSFVKSYIIAEKPDRKYNIYEVNVINPNEKFAKDFTDSLVAATNNFYTEICTKKAKQTLDILEQRVADMKGKVNSSIGTRADIQDVNLNPAFSSAQVPILKEQANIQVYSGAYAEMFKNLEVARYQYLKQIPLMQIIDAANYPMQKIKMGKLKAAIIFSFIAVFLTFLIIWLNALFKLQTSEA